MHRPFKFSNLLNAFKLTSVFTKHAMYTINETIYVHMNKYAYKYIIHVHTHKLLNRCYIAALWGKLAAYHHAVVNHYAFMLYNTMVYVQCAVNRI